MDSYNTLLRTVSLAKKPCDLFTDIWTGLALHSVQGDSTVGPGSNLNEPQPHALTVSVLSTISEKWLIRSYSMDEK